MSNKYARLNARETCNDLEENHGCKISNFYLQNVADSVGAIAQAKEEIWEYTTPSLEDDVELISLSLDGAMVLMCDGSWRESMVGNISLYDVDGERLHSIYLGSSPEYGKHKFKKRFIEEAERVTKLYPNATRIGIADGAADNWSVLNSLTHYQILDFYHATEYLAKASPGFHRGKAGKVKCKAWLKDKCHSLKNDKNGAADILKELEKISCKQLTKDLKQKVTDAIKYFTNHLTMMNYNDYQDNNFPIGSGVTEAACNTISKN